MATTPSFIDQAKAILAQGYTDAYQQGFQDAEELADLEDLDTLEEDVGTFDQPEDLTPDQQAAYEQGQEEVSAEEEGDPDPDDVEAAANDQTDYLASLAGAMAAGIGLGALMNRLDAYAATANSWYEQGFGSSVASTDLPPGGWTVTWRTAGDEGVCQLCDERNGQTWAITDDYPYPGEGLFGEQCEGGPLCRCELDYEWNGDTVASGSADTGPLTSADLTASATADLLVMRALLLKRFDSPDLSAFTVAELAGLRDLLVKYSGGSMKTVPLEDAKFQPWLEAHMGQRMVPPGKKRPPSIAKYSETQARDEHGRWTAEEGGVSAEASPHPGQAIIDDLSRGVSPDIRGGQVHDMMEAGLAYQGKPLAIESVKVEGTNQFGRNGLGIPRSQMPQVPQANTKEYFDYLRSKGISVTHEEVNPHDLQPTQSQISLQRCASMWKAMQEPNPPNLDILVSKDNYVLDGHHRWGAAVALRFDKPDLTIGAWRLGADIHTLLSTTAAFDQQMGISTRNLTVEPDLTKYSPDQPRDDHGRFAGGGDSADGVPPWHSGALDSQTYHKGDTGRYGADRQAIHEQLMSAMFKGATPVDHPVATILGGGPASGKSSMVRSGLLGLPENAVNVNPDDIKTSLPEYKAMVDEGLGTKASAFVHEEGSEVSKVALGRAISGNYNIIYDTTGDNSLANIVGKVDSLRSNGATVNAEYMTCSTDTAWARAQAREQSTGRGVPESYLRDTHASLSRVVPMAIDAKVWDNFRLWDTNGPTPVLAASYTDKGPLTIHDQAAWDAFLAKAG